MSFPISHIQLLPTERLLRSVPKILTAMSSCASLTGVPDANELKAADRPPHSYEEARNQAVQEALEGWTVPEGVDKRRSEFKWYLVS